MNRKLPFHLARPDYLFTVYMEDIMEGLQRFLSTAPVLIMALLTVTAGLLIEFNRFFPDLLFHPLS